MSNPEVSADDLIREAVQERYASAARLSLGGSASSCCGPTEPLRGVDPITSGLYDEQETPFSAAFAASLGCGNPTALAERNRVEAGVENARFLEGSIEDVPLGDSSVDVVISNCVINLSPDKDSVLRESMRVLRPGGRFAVSDIVLLREIPQPLRGVMSLWTGCISGALLDEDYISKLAAAGFVDASVEVTRHYHQDDLLAMSEHLDAASPPEGMDLNAAVSALDGAFASAFIRAIKPGVTR